MKKKQSRKMVMKSEEKRLWTDMEGLFRVGEDEEEEEEEEEE